MADDAPNPVFQGFIDRGLSPIHAAALTGNFQQESSLNPNAVNRSEDAHGLSQWRLDRWQNLQDFAKARGTDPTDRDTQMDFVLHEMQGPEKRAGSRFLAATDLPSANAALKGYIRYGDDTQGQRLGYASQFLGQPGQGGAPVAPGGLAPGIPQGLLAQTGPPPGGMGQGAPQQPDAAPFGLAPPAPGAAQGGPPAPSAPQATAQQQMPQPAQGAPALPMDSDPLTMQRTAMMKARMLQAILRPQGR